MFPGRLDFLLARIRNFAYDASSEIEFALRDQLPDESAQALQAAKQSADRIVRLLNEEFTERFDGGLMEVER